MESLDCCNLAVIRIILITACRQLNFSGCAPARSEHNFPTESSGRIVRHIEKRRRRNENHIVAAFVSMALLALHLDIGPKQSHQRMLYNCMELIDPRWEGAEFV